MALAALDLVTLADAQAPLTIRMKDGGTLEVAFVQSVPPLAPVSVPATVYLLTPRDTDLRTGTALVADLTTYSLTAPVPLINRRLVADATAYTLTSGEQLITRLSLATVAAEFVATGSGNFTIAITSPAPYIGGPYANDLSAEGGNALLNFEALLTAPMCFFKPIITRTAIAPGGTANKVGDTFTITPGLWVYDADDFATMTQDWQWRLDGVDIPGATGMSFTTTAPGALTVRDRAQGAGTTRTAVSNSISIAAVNNTVVVPATPYELTAYAPADLTWSITPGNAAATINSFPSAPTTPAWAITPGDASATITAYPGGS